MKLLAVAGAKGVGKDTFYHILQGRGHHVVRVAFADALKADLADVKGLAGGTKKQLRKIYQFYGQAAKELHGQNYWIDRLEAYLPHIDMYNPNATIILTDVRFLFEAHWVTEQGGKVVVVERPDDGSPDQDISETSWREIECDYRIKNTGTISDYAKDVLKVWDDFNGKGRCLLDGCGLSEATEEGCTRKDCELK